MLELIIFFLMSPLDGVLSLVGLDNGEMEAVLCLVGDIIEGEVDDGGVLGAISSQAQGGWLRR